MFTANLSLLAGCSTQHKKISQHLGEKPLKFAGLPNHVHVSINYDDMYLYDSGLIVCEGECFIVIKL